MVVSDKQPLAFDKLAEKLDKLEKLEKLKILDSAHSMSVLAIVIEKPNKLCGCMSCMIPRL